MELRQLSSKAINRLRSIYKRTLKKIWFLVTRPYYLVRGSWPVWFYLLNRKGRKLHARYRPELTTVQRRLISDLKRNGIAVSHIDELLPQRGLLSVLRGYADKLLPDANVRKGKIFQKELWDSCPVIDFQNPFTRLALEKSVLEIVSGYLDVWPKFRVLTLNVTIPVPLGSEAIKSQRWHRDPEDKRMCKMFLYLNDVDEAAGPFVYVPQSHHGGKWRRFFPQRPPKGYYPPAGAVEKAIPQSELRTMTGRAGTVIFCDTSGLHKGGYATSKERIMFTAGYNTEASLWPIQFKYPDGFNVVTADLHEMAKYALDSEAAEVVPQKL